jgi:hypothetical protein
MNLKDRQVLAESYEALIAMAVNTEKVFSRLAEKISDDEKKSKFWDKVLIAKKDQREYKEKLFSVRSAL